MPREGVGNKWRWKTSTEMKASQTTNERMMRKRDDRDRHDDAVGHQELDRARPVPELVAVLPVGVGFVAPSLSP